MAGRLIRKIRTLVVLTDDQANKLREQSSAIIKRRLTGELPDLESAREEILQLLRPELNPQDLERLQAALKDYRPGQDEP